MSTTIFLVQVRTDFRFLFDSGEGVRRGPGIAGSFPSREQATAWAACHFPIEHNPFVDVVDDEDEDGTEWVAFLDSDEDDVPRQDFCDFLDEIGLLPPEKRKPEGLPLRYEDLKRTPDGAPNWEVWFRWWEATAPEMTDVQKTAIWQYLIKYPYHIVEIEME